MQTNTLPTRRHTRECEQHSHSAYSKSVGPRGPREPDYPPRPTTPNTTTTTIPNPQPAPVIFYTSPPGPDTTIPPSPTSQLKCVLWNIQGLTDKLQLEHIQQYFTKFDIILLSETWIGANRDNKIRSPARAETDTFYCLGAPGSPRPQATGFLGLPGSKMYQFLH